MLTNDILETIRSRRSIRAFKEEQLKDEELTAILEAAIYAPTGHNDQPWHFTVIRNKELINHMSEKAKEVMRSSSTGWLVKMAQSDRHILYKAPTVVVVSGRKNSYSPLTDCSAAVQNMLLAAESLGIGSVWVGIIDHFFTLEKEMEKLAIPEGYEPYFAACLGYKQSDASLPAPVRNREVIHYID